jgi:hypothetical protein
VGSAMPRAAFQPFSNPEIRMLRRVGPRLRRRTGMKFPKRMEKLSLMIAPTPSGAVGELVVDEVMRTPFDIISARRPAE